MAAVKKLKRPTKKAHWKEVEVIGLPEFISFVKFYQCTNCGVIHRGTYLNGLYCEKCNSYMG